MTHHQEIFDVLDPSLPRDYQDRHKTSEDGETYLFDERCPKCRKLKAEKLIRGLILRGSAGRTEQ